jgi:hypothetical protein
VVTAQQPSFGSGGLGDFANDVEPERWAMEGWGCCCFGILALLVFAFLLVVVAGLAGVFLGLLALVIHQVLHASTSGTPLDRKRVAGLLGLALVTVAVCLVCGLVPLNWLVHPTNWLYDPWCLEAPYFNPPVTLQASDLEGVWETHYRRNTDRLVLRADGTFKQVYRDGHREDYVYETPWNEWWLEALPDGRRYVHLQGGRYYREGIKTAEEEGLDHPFPGRFYDPVGGEAVHVTGKLVLNVRTDSSGQLLLLHMWSYSDYGFAMMGCEGQMFLEVSGD